MAGPDRTTTATKTTQNAPTHDDALGADTPTSANVALAKLAATGDLTPHAVAVVLVRYPEERNRILMFLQQTPNFGNRFVQQVVAIGQSPSLRVEAIEQELGAANDRATALLADPTKVSHAQAESLRAQLGLLRNRLQSAAIALPPGDPETARTDALTARANQLIDRLGAVGRSVDARDATHADASSRDSRDVFAEAAKIAPPGYCDLRDTLQEVAPCELDAATRDRYRRMVEDRVQTAHTNWSLAILEAKVDERFKKSELTFEQKLGEALFGLLFGLFERGAKAIVSKSISTASKKFFTGEEIYPGVPEIEPDPETLKLVKKGGEAAAHAGVGAAQKKLTEKHEGTMSPSQVFDGARPELPATQEGFLAATQSLPDLWASNITRNLDQLFDGDLAALVTALPSTDAVSKREFDKYIEGTLKRYKEQVEGIQGDARAIRVANRHGIWRHALVVHETAANRKLHGESRNDETWTGRWKLVRWIDDDMSEMAVDRTVGADRSGVPEAGRMDLIATTGMSGFWGRDKVTQDKIETFDTELVATGDQSLLRGHNPGNTP